MTFAKLLQWSAVAVTDTKQPNPDSWSRMVQLGCDCAIIIQQLVWTSCCGCRGQWSHVEAQFHNSWCGNRNCIIRSTLPAGLVSLIVVMARMKTLMSYISRSWGECQQLLTNRGYHIFKCKGREIIDPRPVWVSIGSAVQHWFVMKAQVMNCGSWLSFLKFIPKSQIHCV